VAQIREESGYVRVARKVLLQVGIEAHVLDHDMGLQGKLPLRKNTRDGAHIFSGQCSFDVIPVGGKFVVVGNQIAHESAVVADALGGRVSGCPAVGLGGFGSAEDFCQQIHRDAFLSCCKGLGYC